jgi:hypothetical protein
MTQFYCALPGGGGVAPWFAFREASWSLPRSPPWPAALRSHDDPVHAVAAQPGRCDRDRSRELVGEPQARQDESSLNARGAWRSA